MQLISIITVNYNNLEGLKKTLASVRNQTWKEFEYIVIDGGSTDGSIKVLEENSKYVNWLSEPDKGVYHAMNKGIKKASGEYVLFLNSGDHFYNNDVLRNNVKELKDKEIIYFDLQVVDNEKAFVKNYPSTLSFSYFVKDTLAHPATFIKKEAFAKTNFYNEDFKIVSDWKFFMDAICKFDMSYKYIGKTLSVFYLGGISSLPENRKIIYNEKQLVLRTEYPTFIRDLDDVLENRNKIEILRKSRIIKWLVKFGFLNKF